MRNKQLTTAEFWRALAKEVLEFVPVSRHWTYKPLVRKLFDHVVVGEPHECWLWQGRRDKQGYGVVSLWGQDKQMGRSVGITSSAHRAMFMVYNRIPPFLLPHLIRHTCDNPPCVNPNHLVGGDEKDNRRDALERGRALTGEAHFWAKLSEKQIQEIRGSSQSSALLAEQYQVNPTTIRRIRSGRTWRGVA